MGVVDIGTNSTRLLVADVEDGRVVRELERRSEVTRLGEGVDRSGRLGDAPMERVFGVLEGYRERIGELECDATTGVLTSAVRDAVNGGEFAAAVCERFGLDARTIDGDTEARLTFAGATSERDPGDRTELVVIDIGGGSTELVVGSGAQPSFHVSTQAGVVRQTERHVRHDPPGAGDVEELGAEVAELFAEQVPEEVRGSVSAGIAVAGTATSCAAMAQGLDPYDPERVHGYVLERSQLESLLARLAALALPERQAVAGLHPDRAPTIVAGVAILLAALDAFGLDRVEASEHDILRGAALARAQT